MGCRLLDTTLLGPTIASSFTTLWVDNDAARHALIAAHAFPDSNRLIVESCLRCETDHSLKWGEVPKFLEGASELEIDVGIVWRLSAGLPAK